MARERSMRWRRAATPHEPGSGWIADHAETIERKLLKADLDLLDKARYHEACDRALHLLCDAVRAGRLWRTPQGHIHGPALARVADLYEIDVTAIAPVVAGAKR